MSLLVADMIGGVHVLVVLVRLGGRWAGCLRWDGLGAVGEGIGAALIWFNVEVLGWVLDWMEGAAVGVTAVASVEVVLVVLVTVRVVREPE